MKQTQQQIIATPIEYELKFLWHYQNGDGFGYPDEGGNNIFLSCSGFGNGYGIGCPIGNANTGDCKQFWKDSGKISVFPGVENFSGRPQWYKYITENWHHNGKEEESY